MHSTDEFKRYEKNLLLEHEWNKKLHDLLYVYHVYQVKVPQVTYVLCYEMACQNMFI